MTKRMVNCAPADRFWARVRKTDSCWLWTGPTREGYGRFWPGGGLPKIDAHRFSYQLHVGPVPADLHVDHRCHESSTCSLADRCPHRRCVNPEHLKAVTPEENIQRSQCRPEVCHRGHSMADADRKTDSRTGRVTRSCATCRREAAARRYAERRTAALRTSTSESRAVA